MKDTYSTEKTLIIASSDAIQICNKLKSTSIRYLLVDGEDNDANKSLMHKWINEKPGKMTVLVCTDEIFKDLRFKNVQHLIHFTLPESWTSFGFRFSSCFDFYMKNVENNEQKSSCLVLLDNENNQTNRELPRLIEFLKSHKLAKISPEIEQMVLSIVKQQELDNLKDFVPFCDKIINFGHCENSLECASRHVFTDWDLPGEQIPKDGRVSNCLLILRLAKYILNSQQIKFEIIKVRTAKQISVKILAKRPVGSNIWVSVCDTAHISLFLQMTNHFNNQDNHQIYAPIILNGLCAISTDTDIHQNSVKYHRCRVLQKVGPKTPAGTPSDSIVVIRLIDDGSVMRVKSNELINLPEQFKVPPAQVVDIYMQDVVPVDFEQSWDKTIAGKLTEIIQQCQQDYPQCSFTCRVNWALADIVMTNTIEITQQLKEIGADVCLVS